MNHKYYLLLFIFAGCKKDISPVNPTAAINIIQALSAVPSVAVNFAKKPIPFYLNQNLIPYGAGTEYGLQAGNNPFFIISSADTSHALISGSLTLAAKGIYSLYLFDGKGGSVDTLFRQDSIPYYATQNAGVRFVNLTDDEQQISVNLEGNDPSNTEFNEIAYKGITEFKSYDAGEPGGYYTFEIHSGGNLLTSFSWYYMTGKSNTIVISGSTDPAGSMPLNIFQVNNY